MVKMKKTVIYILFILLVSCKKNTEVSCDGSTPTYDGEISVIISDNCTSSSCHDAGSKHGAWTSYSNMKEVLDNGKFENSVLIDQNMPKFKNLSEEELGLIKCWADNNYPEN